MSDEERKTIELSKETAEPVREHLSTLQPQPTKCGTKKCKNSFFQNRNKNLTLCEDCRAEAKREYNNNRQKNWRNKKKEDKLTVWDSPEIVSKEDAKQLLTDEWGLQHIHVIETCYELGKLAAESLKISPNHFYWLNAPIQARASIAANKPLPLKRTDGDEIVNGEVIFRAELFALYQFSIAWREVKGKSISFEEFLEYRYKSKTDCLWFGQFVLDRDFQATPHGEWSEHLFVKKIPSLLPGYSQEDVKKFFMSQDAIRNLLLIVSRNAYKTSYQIVDNLQWILCCPDARLLEISAVKSLSKTFIKMFREYWTVDDPRHPSLFAQLFPEMMISASAQSDSTNFQCPMARLGLAQPTMASSSADSSQVGQRCDVLILDDIQDEENAASPELRASLLEKCELIRKLVEPHGFTLIIGTPQAAEGDLYKVVLERSAKNDHKYLRYLIQPAWVVKPEYASVGIHDLTADMVTLLFPSRLTFEFLKSELENGSEKTFRRQNLCEWTDGEDDILRTNFIEDNLRANIIEIGEAPRSKDNIVISCDVAYTTSARADLTALCVTSHYQNSVKEPSMCVLTAEADRWPTSVFGEKIVFYTKEYNPRIVIIEKKPTQEAIVAAINDACRRFCVAYPPIFWLPPSRQFGAKILRMKGLEALVSSTPSRLKFVSGPYIEMMFRQLMFINEGRKSNSSKKRDDLPDALSMAQMAMPKSNSDVADFEEARKLHEEEKSRQRMQDQHDMIFGGGAGGFVSSASEWRANQQSDELDTDSPFSNSPIHRALRPLSGSGGGSPLTFSNSKKPN